MSLHLSECRKMIQGVFCRPDLPEELRDRFSEWMLTHEEDAALQQVMLEMWNSLPESQSEMSTEGLRRLLNDIEMLESKPVAHPRREKAVRYVAAAAVVTALFAGGYMVGQWNSDVFNHQSDLPTTILVTAPGSTGHYILPDHTEVWLNSESTLSYSGNLDGDVREVTLKGEAYFDVAKNPSAPFQVVMDSLQVEVTGTAFDAINYDFAPEQIALQRGSVNVTGKANGMAVTLSPGQIVTRERGTSEISVDNTDCDNYCGWMARNIIFDNRPLSDIVTILERRYAVNITVSPNVDLDKRLSLTISGETFYETSHLIELLIPVKFDTNGNRVKLSRRGHHS